MSASIVTDVDPNELYELVELLGEGSYGAVYKAVDKSSGDEVAIKILPAEEDLSTLRREIEFLQLLTCEYVVGYLGCYMFEDELWICMEYCAGGSVSDLYDATSTTLTEAEITAVVAYTVLGLHHLHSHSSIHRDVKAGNILLSADGEVRLADFGVAGWLVAHGNRRRSVKTFVGTPCWMAPEVMEQVDGYDYKADIWSLGITALELAKGHAPYAHHPPMRVLVMTIEEDPPSLRTYETQLQRNGQPFSNNFNQFVSKCLQKVPAKRPTCEQLLQHKLFKNRSAAPLVEELLRHVDNVGLDEDADGNRLPGTAPVAVDVDAAEGEGKAADGAEGAAGAAAAAQLRFRDAADRPKGTTWVFDDGDGSVVLRRGAGGEAKQQEQTIDEVMDDFSELQDSV
mmetsp:Transcript_2183/g.7648  ORF Transcript_2183/g.7648 Transcript_2183/m.7648 type:complete len:398 (+) Transcript_2183:282-1475(+)